MLGQYIAIIGTVVSYNHTILSIPPLLATMVNDFDQRLSSIINHYQPLGTISNHHYIAVLELLKNHDC